MLEKGSSKPGLRLHLAHALTLAAFASCLISPDSNADTNHRPDGKGGGTLLNPPPVATGPLGAAGQTIQYHGGDIMLGAPSIYFIWYGDWAGNTALDILSDWANNIGGSPYYNINSTYYDHSGNHISNAARFGGAVFDHYSHGDFLSDDDIEDIVADQIGGALPIDENGVYFVLTSADVAQQSSSTSAFCLDYCGWHTHHLMIIDLIHWVDIKYAFVGNAIRCPGSCAAQTASSPNDNPGADAMASVLAHEFEETTSDPDLDAWFTASGDENGDLCVWRFGQEYHTPNGARANMRLGNRDYLIQQNWVNLDGGYCALSLPAVSAISPNWGSRAGGTRVTISGTGFAPNATVSFGGTPATAVSFVDSSTLIATTPPHSFGRVAVSVSAHGGTISIPDAFTFGLTPAQILTVVNNVLQ